MAGFEDIDVVTRRRIGELAAYSMLATQIADVLLVPLEQVEACRESPEYKESYSNVVQKRTQMKIDLEEGWDAVEEKALETVLSALEYTRDPTFALAAATRANMAKRRASQDERPRAVIDASGGAATNIVILNINRKYINKSSDTAGTIDVTPSNQRLLADVPRKRVDVMAPKTVEKLLDIKTRRSSVGEHTIRALDNAMDLAGIRLDVNE